MLVHRVWMLLAAVYLLPRYVGGSVWCLSHSSKSYVCYACHQPAKKSVHFIALSASHLGLSAEYYLPCFVFNTENSGNNVCDWESALLFAIIRQFEVMIKTMVVVG